MKPKKWLIIKGIIAIIAISAIVFILIFLLIGSGMVNTN